MTRLGIGLLAVLVFAATAAADLASPQEALREAAETYAKGLDTERRGPRLEEFRRSQRLFASVAARHVATAALYTNLGNAALQADDLGAAVLAYRRALELDADYPRAVQNLDHARSLLPSWVPRPGPADALDSLFFWHRSVPAPIRELLAAICFAVVAVLWAASLRWDQSALRNAAVLPGLVWLVVLGSVVLDSGGRVRGEAVVTVAEAVARAADSRLAPSAFPHPLPGGVELRILEERSSWLRVRLANGRDAWLNRSSVTRFAPSEAEAG